MLSALLCLYPTDPLAAPAAEGRAKPLPGAPQTSQVGRVVLPATQRNHMASSQPILGLIASPDICAPLHASLQARRPPIGSSRTSWLLCDCLLPPPRLRFGLRQPASPMPECQRVSPRGRSQGRLAVAMLLVAALAAVAPQVRGQCGCARRRQAQCHPRLQTKPSQLLRPRPIPVQSAAVAPSGRALLDSDSRRPKPTGVQRVKWEITVAVRAPDCYSRSVMLVNDEFQPNWRSRRAKPSRRAWPGLCPARPRAAFLAEHRRLADDPAHRPPPSSPIRALSLSHPRSSRSATSSRNTGQVSGGNAPRRPACLLSAAPPLHRLARRPPPNIPPAGDSQTCNRDSPFTGTGGRCGPSPGEVGHACLRHKSALCSDICCPDCKPWA